MSKKNLVKKLIETLGGRYSTQLGIDLSRNDEGEIFKWFLASKLYGARITEKIATHTYLKFQEYKVVSPDDILKAGWDGLVKILDEGGYVRYDFSTATKLLEIMKDLKQRYQGSLKKLYEESKDGQELKARLKGLGKGIGEVTCNIFLREMRSIWKKASPEASPLVVLAARRLKLIGKTTKKNKFLAELIRYWSSNQIEGFTFSDLEAALLRLGKDYLRKGKAVDWLKNE